MKVYHGGTTIIDHPDVVKGRAGLDFGRGFYVTDLKKQADDAYVKWVQLELEIAKYNLEQMAQQ